jgi:hypothetical protein
MPGNWPEPGISTRNGQVAFKPAEKSTAIRIRVNQVNFATTDKLVEFLQDVEKRLNVPTNIKRIDFHGRPAVERSFNLKGLDFMLIDSMVGRTNHNQGLPTRRTRPGDPERGFRQSFFFNPADYAVIAMIRLSGRLTPDGIEEALRTLLAGLIRADLPGKLWIIQKGRIRTYQPED